MTDDPKPAAERRVNLLRSTPSSAAHPRPEPVPHDDEAFDSGMVGVRTMLAALHDRHILKLRSLATLLQAIEPPLARWLDHALTWEECRRTGLLTPLVPIGEALAAHDVRRAIAVVARLRGRLVDGAPVRLLLAAVRTELLRLLGAPCR